MDEQRIQKQIAIYMTDKKLCEFNDKLKLAPVGLLRTCPRPG